MRHAKVERWASGSSPIHRLHPAAKTVAILIILITISTLQPHAIAACGAYLVLLIVVTKAARLPASALLLTAAAVVPLAGSFALISFFAGQNERALLLLTRSYVSSYGALLLISTTSMPSLISGLEWLRVPKFLLLVMQFLYRYLVVLFAEAAAVRDAMASRGGSIRSLQLQQSGAAAGVLFARSYQRASSIHRAMLARGFEGSIPTIARNKFLVSDTLFVALTGTFSVGIRVLFS